MGEVRQVSAPAVAAALAAGDPVLLVDVRQPAEVAICTLPGPTAFIPLGELAVRAGEIDPAPGTLVVCVCHHGVRSYKAAAFLAQAGVENVASLYGGTEAWSLSVDPAVRRY